MFSLFMQTPESCEVRSDMRQVFLYATPQDSINLPNLAFKIRNTSAGTNCLVKWLNPAEEVDELDLINNLLNSQVLILLITPTLLSKIREDGLPVAVRTMQEYNRRYFPIATNAILLEDYCKADRPMHGLSLDDYEIDEKLSDQMDKILLNDAMLKQISEKAVADKIFMSYRKIDTRDAQILMRKIHDLPNLAGVSIWYDRLLTAGEDFNEIILQSIDTSSAFVMAITPNIASQRPDGFRNFVVSREYPHAMEQSKPIIPIKVVDGNYENLPVVFAGIQAPLVLEEAEELFQRYLSNLSPLSEYTTERLYYLSVAYLNGFFYEQDQARAVQLLEYASEKTNEFALKAANLLADLFKNGEIAGANYAKELALRVRVAELSEHVLGKEHPDTATAYNIIGSVYSNQGNYPKALEWCQKALAIRERVLSKEHPSIANSYHNIASVYSSQGDNTKALEWSQKALAFCEKVLGKEHFDTTYAYHNIALVYFRQGDYPKALEWYHRALTIREKVLGKEHSSTATTYNNIALVYSRQGDYPRALEWYAKALATYEKVLGMEHSSTAAAYNNIALVYSRQGEYPRALEWYSKALTIDEKVLGKEHPATANSYHNIASVYSSQGDNTKALEWSRKALAICEKVLGKKHPATAATYSNIANIYSRQGDYPRALVWYQKDLVISEKALGKEHPDTAATYNNIALVYSRQGDYPKALEWFGKALTIVEKVLGKEHPSTAYTYKNIASVYDNQGGYPRALELYQKALDVFKKRLGAEHPDTQNVQNKVNSLERTLTKG